MVAHVKLLKPSLTQTDLVVRTTDLYRAPFEKAGINAGHLQLDALTVFNLDHCAVRNRTSAAMTREAHVIGAKLVYD